jgi:uncharacterized protein YbjT (DUF2867 family)
VVVRDPGRLPDGVRERVEVVTGSHSDAEVVDRAFEGADAVFWLVPPDASLTRTSLLQLHASCRQGACRPRRGPCRRCLRARRGTPVADRAGLVTASLAAADLIGSYGVAYRALADPSFSENILEEVDSIRENGVFTDTVDGDRKAPLVAVADVAAVAADLLLDRYPAAFLSSDRRTCPPTTWPAS